LPSKQKVFCFFQRNGFIVLKRFGMKIFDFYDSMTDTFEISCIFKGWDSVSTISLPKPCAAYTGREPYIFISYAHVDGDRMYPEIKALNDRGYRIWYDEGIDPGSEWREEIARAITGCAKFIVFISRNAIQSPNVKKEINFALDKNKHFLAVHLEEVSLSSGLELSMRDIQGVMKWRLSKDEYSRKMLIALPGNCLEKTETAIKKGPPLQDSVMNSPQPASKKKPTYIFSLSLDMVRVPGAAKFPIGSYDSNSCEEVNYPYEMGKTAVTYKQWKKVYDWAVKQGYAFANPGKPGSDGSGNGAHPVTEVSWRDAIVWCFDGDYFRVIRGGSWNDSAYYLQLDWKGEDSQSSASNYLGFRLVRTL
jgi:hypothetical protein